MEQNSILLAPQLVDSAQLYQIWLGNHCGSEYDFYRFMTTPSVDRDAFMAAVGRDVDVSLDFVSETLMTTV